MSSLNVLRCRANILGTKTVTTNLSHEHSEDISNRLGVPNNRPIYIEKLTVLPPNMGYGGLAAELVRLY